MNHNPKVLTAILTTLGVLLAGPLPAADEALLDVLLRNGVITKAQREALIDTKKSPAKPADAISAKPAPADDQGLLDVLLENGLISQAQFATLQVKTAQQKRTEQEARASLKDGIKLKSQDGAFQAQIGAYAQLDSAFYSDNPTDFSDATQLRRTRLSVAGTVYQDWDYKVEADFAGTTQGGSTNEVTITDAYLRYKCGLAHHLRAHLPERPGAALRGLRRLARAAAECTGRSDRAVRRGQPVQRDHPFPFQARIQSPRRS